MVNSPDGGNGKGGFLLKNEGKARRRKKKKKKVRVDVRNFLKTTRIVCLQGKL